MGKSLLRKPSALIESFAQLIERRLNRRRRNLMYLTLACSFRSLAGSLGLFYLPLFLYQLAQSVNWFGLPFTSVQKGMIMIAFFYFLERFISAVLIMIKGKLTLKIGHDWSMIVGTVFYAFFILSLTYAQTHPWLILLSVLFTGLQLVFFWPSYHTLLSRWSNKRSMGKSLGGVSFLSNFTLMIAPAVGGLIISIFGYDYLFFASVILVMIGLVFFFKLEGVGEKDEVSFAEYRQWLQEKAYQKLVAAQGGRYFYDMMINLWPLYVFLLLGNVEKVGYLYSLSLFAAMIVGLFSGSIIDRRKKNIQPFYFSGGILSFLSAMRLGIASIWGVVIVDSLSRVVGNFHWLVNNQMVYRRGKGSQEFSYWTYLEFNRSVAAAVYWLFVIIFFFMAPVGWVGLFTMGAVGVLMTLLTRESKDPQGKEG